jgi:putative phage-type endonuclease
MIGLTATQLQERRGFLGASDVPAVVGLSKYAGARDVWLGKALPLTSDAGEAAEWGHRLEQPIALKYCELAGLDPLDMRRGVTHAKPGAPWARATPDREFDDRLLECKTAGERAQRDWGATWGLDVPAEPKALPLAYWVQVQWQMLVTEAWRTDVAALLVGQKFRVYRLEFHAAFASALFQWAETFWTEHVEAGLEPPPGAEAVARRDLQKRFPAIVPADW